MRDILAHATRCTCQSNHFKQQMQQCSAGPASNQALSSARSKPVGQAVARAHVATWPMHIASPETCAEILLSHTALLCTILPYTARS